MIVKKGVSSMVEIVKSDSGKAVFARLTAGEDLIQAIKETAKKAGIDFGVFLIIGTLREATFGFYSPSMKPVTIEEPLEILSCIGNVKRESGELKVHAHIVVSDSKFHSYGGHLLEGNKIDRVGELFLIGMDAVKET